MLLFRYWCIVSGFRLWRGAFWYVWALSPTALSKRRLCGVEHILLQCSILLFPFTSCDGGGEGKTLRGLVLL